MSAASIKCMRAVVSGDAQPAVLNSYQVSQKPSQKQKKMSLRHEVSLQHLDFVYHVKSHAMRIWKSKQQVAWKVPEEQMPAAALEMKLNRHLNGVNNETAGHTAVQK
tara:strand:- start:146 stop:466 length:321 start_codon:yes stop_codon:yes gene_type:complete